MDADAPAIRPARDADAEAVVAVTLEGFATYRAFARPGWSPLELSPDELRERWHGWDVWGFVAEHAGEIVGYAACSPARDGREGPLVPGLGHVGALFVSEPWWGRGVAPALHARLLERLREAGFREGRLYCATGQARARAFYAREGWREVRELRSPELDLDIVELRRPL